MSYLLRGNEIDACLHRVVLSRLPDFRDVRQAPTPEALRRRREAEAHRRRVFDLWHAHRDDVVEVVGEEETLAALESGVGLILNPRLVDADHTGAIAAVQALCRVGRNQERFAYVPVVVKNHEVTESSTTRYLQTTPLSSLGPANITRLDGVGLRNTPTVRRDGLLLSGATRILAALGYAYPATRGVLVDRQQRAFWLDLASPGLHRFNLEAYDQLFRERRDVLDALTNDDATIPTAPYWHRECETCEFAAHCHAELESRDDVSLVRFTNQRQQALLAENGVRTRHNLAVLDPHRAAQWHHHQPAPDERFAVEDALAPHLDKLDELIYRARARVQGSSLRMCPSEETSCPTADVEVDVDMESYNDRTYLWGASVSLRRPVAGLREGYVAFVDWSPLDATVEAKIFADFWQWLNELREQATSAGASFAAYCFWASAEDGAMNRAVQVPLANGPVADDLHAFRQATPRIWIDMHDVVKRQIQTEGPTGLKQMATAAGFAWRDESPSGEASILWYEEAVGDDPDRAAASRTRLLTYNEDDCRATKALRDWLNGPAKELPHRDEV